ncbi:MAG: 2-dehydropantoate 2-reductase [Actinomycetales bacterium]|nr:2-dehydropantoate 2-reductase [Actinomycetales bacterium]
MSRIAVLGAGANGGAIAADLLDAGLDVTLIEQWPEHVETIRREGLTVVEPERTRTVAARAWHLCDLAGARERFDVVLLVVKAYDTRWACAAVRSVLADDGVVVAIQNGMTLDAVDDLVGPERSLGCVIEIASGLFEPGSVVRQTPAAGTWFALGGWHPVAHARAAAVAEILAPAGRVEVRDDIAAAKWTKLVANAAELVTSAILDLPLAQAARIDGMLEVMRANGREAARAGIAAGHRLAPIFGLREPDPDPDRYASALLDIVLADYSMPDTLTTVLQDWRKGRRAEIDEIHGTVVRTGTRHGVPVSANRRTWELARRIEAGQEHPGLQHLRTLGVD